MFENLGKIPATVINSTKAVCVAPPSYVLRQSIVEITLNNQQYSDDNNIFNYYRPPYLFDTNPREGPVSGGTKVIAIGSNFRETANITCKFNETEVPGKYLSSSEIECIAPVADHPGFVPLSIALELEMYSPSL
jgi:IPT/TIG domain